MAYHIDDRIVSLLFVYKDGGFPSQAHEHEIFRAISETFNISNQILDRYAKSIGIVKENTPPQHPDHPGSAGFAALLYAVHSLGPHQKR